MLKNFGLRPFLKVKHAFNINEHYVLQNHNKQTFFLQRGWLVGGSFSGHRQLRLHPLQLRSSCRLDTGGGVSINTHVHPVWKPVVIMYKHRERLSRGLTHSLRAKVMWCVMLWSDLCAVVMVTGGILGRWGGRMQSDSCWPMATRGERSSYERARPPRVNTNTHARFYSCLCGAFTSASKHFPVICMS